MSHNSRTARRSRIALGLGTAAGASLAAAFISMGTASAFVEAPDPFDDLGVPGGSTLDSGLFSLSPTFAGQLDGYADNIVTTDNGAFADLFGTTSGTPLDNAFSAFSAQLDPFADALTPFAPGDPDSFADLFGTTFGAPLDAAFGPLSSALSTASDAINVTDVDPFTELLGATMGAPIDSFLDIPFGTTTVGGFFDVFADALLNAGFSGT